MAPGGTGKRKRGDRTYSYDNNDGQRPSPHRPGNLNLAQQNYHNQQGQQYGFNRDSHDQRGRGGRRVSRGGRGGGPPRSPFESPNGIQFPSRQANSTSNAMSPPAAPQQPVEGPVEPTPTLLAPPVITVSTQTPPPNPNYHYEYLTTELRDTWQESGRATFVGLGKKAVEDGDIVTMGLIFQEIVRAGLDGRIDAIEAGLAVKDILGEMKPYSEVEEPSPSLAASLFFLDCLPMEKGQEDLTNPSFQPLVLSTGIPAVTMRKILSIEALESLGLVRSTFGRVNIRHVTHALYKQANYNLLREETEGFAKLVTELFTASSDEPSAEIVEETFERVRAMIGAFDLDVGRAFDIFLDVFAAVLVKNFRFIVKFLRVSTWWPQEALLGSNSTSTTFSGLPRWALPDVSGWSKLTEEEKTTQTQARQNRDEEFWKRVKEVGMKAFFEIGCQKADTASLPPAATTQSGEGSSQEEEDRKWIKATGTLPPPGNKIVAQILGFKLRFYSSSARDPNDVLPENLIFLAALLIKIGFISLRDLYQHLWPEDDAMEKVKEEKMKEKLEREKLRRPGGGALNALMTHGALPDDTLPNGSRSREMDNNRGHHAKSDTLLEKEAAATKTGDKEELPEPLDQKVQLLKSLLCIGAIPESLYILGRFPWLVDAFLELPEHIHRILHQSLSKVYEPLQPLKWGNNFREPHRITDPDQSGVPKGQVRLIDPPVRKVLRWAQIDRNDTNEGKDYRFYWDDWSDNVPICQNVDDVFLLCGTLLNYSGVKIGQDPSLLCKLARIGCSSLSNDESEENTARWIDLSKKLLVPALSLMKSNSAVVNEVWNVIKQFPIQTRYSIYAEWYHGSVSRLPDIKAAFDETKAETKDVLKRLAKENVKTMAKRLAKAATASPGIVFSITIGQIESYENLIEVVVDCGRNFTWLGYDVLTWSLLSSLGAKGRNRVKADGMLTSKWLLALSQFTGKAFKRYGVMSPTPLLQYVTDQLRQDNSTDLVVLEAIIGTMAGIVSDTNFNERQVQGMAGGQVLRNQIMLQLLDRRHDCGASSRRLIKSLVEPKLAGKLLISIAQERQTCIFKIPEEDAHLKLLGNLFDEIHRVLTQYLDLLRSKLSVKEFNALVPDVIRLIGEFGLDPGVAFWISRPSITKEIQEHDAMYPYKPPDRTEPVPEKQIEPVSVQDIEMVDSDNPSKEEVPSSDADDSKPSPPAMNGHVEGDSAAKDVPYQERTTQSLKVKSEVDTVSHPVLQPLMEKIRPVLPQATWEVLGEAFYIRFWQLSLGDFFWPESSYDEEIERVKKKIVAIGNDRSDMSTTGLQKKEENKKKQADIQMKLLEEKSKVLTLQMELLKRLRNEKLVWFANCWGKWDSLNVALIEHCFIPRIMISPVEAIYTWKLIRWLHINAVPNFRTMGLFDQLFNRERMTSLMFLSTWKEAENFARFLNELLKELGRWHADKAVFEKEAYGNKRDYPGFCKKMADDKSNFTFLEYEDFRRLLQKWHMNLHGALKACFTSGEYMHIRNATAVLRTLCWQFPVINWMGQAQVACITEVSKSDTRVDLKVAVTSLLGNLRRREKEWVLPQAFSFNKAPPAGINGVRSNSVKPSTPQPEADASKGLNAKAPEFTPSSQPNAMPKLVTTSSGRVEVEDGEDGEINDSMVGVTSTAAESTATSDQPTKATNELPVDSSSDQQMLDGPIESDPTGQNVALQAEDEQLRLSEDTSATSHPQPHKPPPRSEIVDQTSQAQLPPRPIRPDLSRKPLESSPNSRGPHSLPGRPDALPTPSRVGEQRMAERLGERGPRDMRDSRFPEQSRSERPNDSMRDRLHERHISGSYSHSHERLPERPPYNERERNNQNWGGQQNLPNRPPTDDRYNSQHGPPSRDMRPSTRDDRPDRPTRDRSHVDPLENTRNIEGHGRSSRDSSMAPPRSNVSQHPDRLALIHGPQDSERSHPHSDRRSDSRYDNHSNSQRGSRTTSPTGNRRDDHRPTRHDHHYDDRSSFEARRPQDDVPSSHQSHYDDTRPPTGPRTDRHGDTYPNGPSDGLRETIRAPRPAALSSDPNHGRLTKEPHDSVREQDMQYGRLNVEPPSGPRMSNGTHPSSQHGGRNVSAPHPSINTQLSPVTQGSLQSPTVADRQAPTGPSSNRQIARSSAPFSRPPPVSSSGPPTPITEDAEGPAIHPERLRAMERATGMQQSSSARSSNQNVPSPISTAPPAGPRAGNNAQPPSPMSSRHAGPPTGPSSREFSVSDRGRGDKRFAGIQNVLQQASAPSTHDRSSQGTSIRGRGGRMNNTGNHIQSPIGSGPNTPLLPRQDERSQRQDFSASRDDLFANRSSNGPTSSQHPHEDVSYGRGGRREGDLRRSARHEESRSHSRDHLVNDGPPSQSMPLSSRDDIRQSRRAIEDQQDQRDHRVRGTGGGPPPHMAVERDSRRPPRQDMIAASKERDRRMDDGRREQEDWGATRGPGPERRDERERRDTSGVGGPRKRGRGVEDAGPGMGGYNTDGKRPRRNG